MGAGHRHRCNPGPGGVIFGLIDTRTRGLWVAALTSDDVGPPGEALDIGSTSRPEGPRVSPYMYASDVTGGGSPSVSDVSSVDQNSQRASIRSRAL